MSDEDLFKEELDGVTPIQQQRVQRDSQGRTQSPSLTQQAARKAAMENIGGDGNPLADNFIPEVDPHAILEYGRPGVQHGVLKKMRLGKYAVDARLDLHKHTVEQARTAVYQFSQDCLRYDVRTALIVHGKGEKAIIKSCVNYWLRDLPDVLAFHTAQKQHGGAGAVYVLFRKSDSQKLANKEKHSKR
ncbi:MAG: DNA endonuclease SmrA [Pseudomonadales bacterium]